MHGHDLDLATAQTYEIGGASPHTHQVTLGAAQLASLKAGGVVAVTSSLAEGHAHAVTVNCA